MDIITRNNSKKMDRKTRKGFTLIEVVIATGIITITVFGVYKLISENTKVINNSGSYFQVNSLYSSLKECINSIPSTSFLGSTYYFGFGTDLQGCTISSSNSGVIIDDIYYEMRGDIINNTLEYIDWELVIFSDYTKKISKEYRQIK